MIDIDGNLAALRQRMIEEEEHDARWKDCPECDGTGTATWEEPVIDYEHGGYLQEVSGECCECGGSGQIEDYGDDDEDNA
jgi:DnaJ-class molecular chaperone